MEIRQHVTAQLMGQRKIQKIIKNNTLRQKNGNISNFFGWSKSNSKREVHSVKCLPQETRKVSNKQSNLTPKGTRKTKPKVIEGKNK